MDCVYGKRHLPCIDYKRNMREAAPNKLILSCSLVQGSSDRIIQFDLSLYVT